MGKRELMTVLEGMIDRNSINGVLSALSEVCGEKADHLRSNWQDDATAKAWERAGKAVDKAQAVAFDNGL